MKNVPIRHLAALLGSEADLDLYVSGYQIDSRFILPGNLFFALPGRKTDGHLHLSEAASRGAIAAIVDLAYQGDDHGLVLIRVSDVERALKSLAALLLKEKSVQIVGITGSVGKTTVKEFAATLLEGKYKVEKSPLSYNSQLTFPLNLLNRQGDEEILVLEMGMSRPSELKQLVEIAPPDLAVVTMVGLSHAEAFPLGLAEIAKEKCSIFSHPHTKKAIFFQGLLQYEEAMEQIQGEKISFSLEDRNADYFLSFSEGKYLVDERGVRVYQLDLPFSRPHVLHNFLAAVAVAREFKVDWDTIHRQISLLALPKMRFEEIERGGILFINDAYNASPESMRAALSSLPMPKEGGKRIAVLGTMKELGHFSKEAHREVGRWAQKHIDHLLVLGEEAIPLCEAFAESKKPSLHASNLFELAKELDQLMSPGDVVLIKGSRSLDMQRLFELIAIQG